MQNSHLEQATGSQHLPTQSLSHHTNPSPLARVCKAGAPHHGQPVLLSMARACPQNLFQHHMLMLESRHHTRTHKVKDTQAPVTADREGEGDERAAGFLPRPRLLPLDPSRGLPLNVKTCPSKQGAPTAWTPNGNRGHRGSVPVAEPRSHPHPQLQRRRQAWSDALK